jgi:hypothetical protein
MLSTLKNKIQQKRKYFNFNCYSTKSNFSERREKARTGLQRRLAGRRFRAGEQVDGQTEKDFQTFQAKDDRRSSAL